MNSNQFILGPMRWSDKGLTVNEAKSLIEKSFEYGINTHHISNEYSSYSLYAEAFRLLDVEISSQIKVIAKVGFPNFRETYIESTLIENVDSYLVDLGIDRLYALQWLDRWDQLNEELDPKRIQRFEENKTFISEEFAQLKAEGKIQKVYSFPYSVKYFQNLFQFEAVDGFTIYANRFEKEYTDLLPLINKEIIGIRPLGAGKIKNQEEIKNDFYHLEKTGVSQFIIGINNIDQLISLTKICS